VLLVPTSNCRLVTLDPINISTLGKQMQIRALSNVINKQSIKAIFLFAALWVFAVLEVTVFYRSEYDGKILKLITCNGLNYL
jgi:hypothetical protein